MAYSRRLFTNVNEVFHGLSNVYAIPQNLAQTANATKSLTTIKVAGSATGRADIQAAFLSGGDAVPTAATLTFEFAGTITAGCTVCLTFPEVTINSNLEDVTIETDIQSANTLATLMDAVKVNVDAVVAGAGALTNGRVYTTNNTNTRAQIATGMALKFDTPGTIIIAAGVGTITGADTGGTVQNAYDVVFEVRPKPPSIVALSGAFPQVAGLKHLGLTQGLVFNATGNETPIESDQDFFPATNYLTGAAAELTLNILQDLNTDFVRFCQGISSRASTNSYDVLLPSFLSNTQTYGLIVTTDSQTVSGSLDIAVFGQIRGNSVSLSRTRTHAPIAAKFSLDKLAGRELCYLALARSSFQ